MICNWKHCNSTIPPSRKKYCSLSCKNKGAADENRKKTKAKAIEYLGGKCCLCGYNKCSASLDFHHVDPSTKEFGIGAKGLTRSWEKTKIELDKCILVCKNCHGELHYK